MKANLTIQSYLIYTGKAYLCGLKLSHVNLIFTSNSEGMKIVFQVLFSCILTLGCNILQMVNRKVVSVHAEWQITYVAGTIYNIIGGPLIKHQGPTLL